MSVPGRVESAALLLSLEPLAWHLGHSRAVGEVAGWLALAAERNGIRLDRRLTESAALLHDLDKLPRVKEWLVANRPDGLRHGEGSAVWLAARGYPELGEAIEGHPVTRFADGEWFERWLAESSPQALIVAYADKRAGGRLEPMEARFASWRRRYPPASGSKSGWTLQTIEAVWARSLELEKRVCRLAAVDPGEVRRLPWTGAAIAAARARLGEEPS